MLYICGSSRNVKEIKFFTTGNIIGGTVILASSGLLIWQKDNIWSFLKGKKIEKSDEKNKKKKDDAKKIELFKKEKKDMLPFYQDSDSRDFKIYPSSDFFILEEENGKKYAKSIPMKDIENIKA